MLKGFGALERLLIVLGSSLWSQWGRGGVAKRGTLKAQGTVPVDAKADRGRAGRRDARRSGRHRCARA